MAKATPCLHYRQLANVQHALPITAQPSEAMDGRSGLSHHSQRNPNSAQKRRHLYSARRLSTRGPPSSDGSTPLAERPRGEPTP